MLATVSSRIRLQDFGGKQVGQRVQWFQRLASHTQAPPKPLVLQVSLLATFLSVLYLGSSLLKSTEPALYKISTPRLNDNLRLLVFGGACRLY